MVMPNKLGIGDAIELAFTEGRVSKAHALELYRSGELMELPAGTFHSLATIHRLLFADLYDFAGEVRNVNIAKGGFRFTSELYLASALRAIDTMPQSSFDEIAEKYVEMNVAHPFREGNGRSMRIWVDAIFRHSLGMTVMWDAIARDDYLLAMERSPVRDTEIKLLLRGALTGDLDDWGLLARGIDASYAYEGYQAFSTKSMLGEQ